VKTVAKKSPSTMGARSTAARGRSRAIAVTAASWYGRAPDQVREAAGR
jgi:hypothetical protein